MGCVFWLLLLLLLLTAAAIRIGQRPHDVPARPAAIISYWIMHACMASSNIRTPKFKHPQSGEVPCKLGKRLRLLSLSVPILKTSAAALLLLYRTTVQYYSPYCFVMEAAPLKHRVAAASIHSTLLVLRSAAVHFTRTMTMTIKYTAVRRLSVLSPPPPSRCSNPSREFVEHGLSQHTFLPFLASPSRPPPPRGPHIGTCLCAHSSTAVPTTRRVHKYKAGRHY